MTVRAFLGIPPMNQRGAVTHPPVIRQRKGPAFQWHDGQAWRQGDELPAPIASALPGPLWEACEAHRYRRMGDQRAA